MSFDHGTNVVLVDTPGFDDTYLSDFDILQTVAKWLKNVYASSNFLKRTNLNSQPYLFFLFIHFF